jgi:WD40 repeat protein
VEFVTFRRDAKVLATAADDGKVRLWDVSDPAHPRRLATIDDTVNQYVYPVAFSRRAAPRRSGTTWRWHTTSPARACSPSADTGTPR